VGIGVRVVNGVKVFHAKDGQDYKMVLLPITRITPLCTVETFVTLITCSQPSWTQALQKKSIPI